MRTAEYWKERLQLQEHPEGGYYREIYRSTGIIFRDGLPARYTGSRSYSTAIYYLLKSGDRSLLHRIRSDEQWFHIDGTALIIHAITPDGQYTRHRIGKNIEEGELPYAIIEQGAWFGGTVEGEGSFALVGCVVAPGFDFEDFELADRTAVAEEFPQHRSVIELLTR